MFGRPRCREWTPLATQQLRLRSLIQIVGYNIRPPEYSPAPCSFYLTLHHTTMSAPFYTSEKISSPHPKWKEIDSEITQQMSSTNVVIRIWCHIYHSANRVSEEKDPSQDTIIQTWGVYFSGLRYIGANLALNFNSDCFKSNTLVFQMHGGYFCSYKSLKLDIIPHENEMEYGSQSSDSSGKTNLSKTLEQKIIEHHKQVKESRSLSPNKYVKINNKEYSKSNSPLERGFVQNFPNFPSMKTSASLNIVQSHRDQGRQKNKTHSSQLQDPAYIYEYSPENLDVKEFTSDASESSQTTSQKDLNRVDLSETAENYDLRNESDGVPKYRYLALNFLKSEIRPSYNASKLQKLHILQYSIKKKQDAVQELKERIYKKSALANANWLDDGHQYEVKHKFRSRSQRNLFCLDETEDVDGVLTSSQSDTSVKNSKVKESKPTVPNGPRLTLKLNDLLSFKATPSPFQRAEHVRLTKQLEILRFKRILLSDERDSKMANLRGLKEKRAKLCEENQDVGVELMENYHTLSRLTESLKETRQSCSAIREIAARTYATLCNRRSDLLTQLLQIFYIEQKDASTWTICGVPLPVCGDEVNRFTSPVSDSVAAGFAAQATCLCAALLNQPLRYKITLLGSATKVLDVTPSLPDPNIPLFARGGDTNLFHYAMFLLNKCIAQLLWNRGLPVTDMRPTLANLHRLMSADTHLRETSRLFGTYRVVDKKCPRTQSLRSLVASDRAKYRPFNRFKDAIDGQSPESVLNLKLHRQSRSVGSYQDDQEIPALDQSTASVMGSESNIYDMKLTKLASGDLSSLSVKAHNSDSELSRLTEQEAESKFIFTLGEDTCLSEIQTQTLVKLSSNNLDENCSQCLNDNVKRICSEIEDFCSADSSGRIHEGFDVVQHLDNNESNIDIAKFMECNVTLNEDTCDSCEKNNSELCDLSCANNVTDVIVIPSAEAILDTGQVSSDDVSNILS